MILATSILFVVFWWDMYVYVRVCHTGGLLMKRRTMKGPVRARGGAGLVTRTSVSLNREAEEGLFRVAEVLSEGGCRNGHDGSGVYYGSTMITFQLRRLASHWRGKLDEDKQVELAAVVQSSVRVRLRAIRLAHAEALRRVPDRPMGTAQVETRVRLMQGNLHLDVDLEAPVGAASAGGGKK